MSKKNKKIALFSVPVHTGLESFAQILIKKGWRIIATNNVYKFLKEKKIETTDVSEFTGVNGDYGFPPTLHPKMEAALTTDFYDRIDLVYDIPYSMDVGNDVGGRTLLALAAKGNRIPVLSTEDMEKVVKGIVEKGEIPADFAKYLREKANYEISKHYFNLAIQSNDYSGIMGYKHRMLKEGENMYQQPCILFKTNDDPLGIGNFKQVSGNTPCFTNIADLESILETLCKLQSTLILNGVKKPYIMIAAKHGNACGIGVSLKEDPLNVINDALWGNAKAIWGGEVITNFPIDKHLAKMLKRSEKRESIYNTAAWMLDVIATPGMTEEAIGILSSNPNRKLFINPALSSSYLRKEEYTIRQLRGGFISQPPADYILDLKKVKWVNKPKNKKNYISLMIAWATAFTSNHGGNEVAIAKNGALLGVGGGSSTYDAVNTAITRAKEYCHNLEGAVFGADAFFPFTDVPDILFKAGCIGGTVPSQGKREKEVIKYFKEHKMSVGMIPEQYRGFCRH